MLSAKFLTFVTYALITGNVTISSVSDILYRPSMSLERVMNTTTNFNQLVSGPSLKSGPPKMQVRCQLSSLLVFSRLPHGALIKLLTSIPLFVRLYALNNSRIAEWIFMKYDIYDFLLNLLVYIPNFLKIEHN
jgi:hypothetical protein